MFAKTFAAIALASVVAAAQPAAADPFERWVDISNHGDAAIVRVQISDIHDGGWGGNLIRNAVINVGDVMTIEPRFPNGYCRFDMRITFSDGFQQEIWDVNLCEATDILTDGFDYDVYYV